MTARTGELTVGTDIFAGGASLRQFRGDGYVVRVVAAAAELGS